LYAFGVRYLLVHNTRGKFPLWATREIGKFQLSRRFDDTLVYENKNARTRFLPENYWSHFSLAIEQADNSPCELVLTFQSPENYFVSKTKTSLGIRLEGEGNRILEEKELTFFPDLWQNGNKYNIALKEKSCAARKIFFILDEKKRDTRFTPGDTSPSPDGPLKPE
jgi:hypothetical protein